MSFIKHIKWGVEFAAYRSLEFLLRQFSIAHVHAIGSALGRLGHRCFSSHRRVVFRNLRIAFGDCLSLDELRLLTKRVFAHTGANLFCSLRTPGISTAELEDILEIRNLDTLRRLIAKGKGVILLGPHMGNWELLAQCIHWLPEGAALGTHYRPLNNPYVNARVERQRTERGTQLFAKKESPHAMARFLRSGGTLGILADQRAGIIGHCCSYYGRFSSCSPFPELLSRRTGAALVSISLESLEPGRWRCTFRHVPHNSTPASMAAMEEATRQSPSDVFWFQDRWRINKVVPFALPGKRHKEADPGTSCKPVRFLYWLQPGETHVPPLPEGARPDLRLEVACPSGTAAPGIDGHPWHRTWTTDPSLQPEQLPRLLSRIDEADQLPLDAILLLTPNPHLRKAAKRGGIPAVVVGS